MNGNGYRIVIRRGTHRDEAVAFYLAPKVCQYLQEHGYDCALETKPLLATTWGEMLKGQTERFDFTEKGDIYFTFHNSDFQEFGNFPYFLESERTCNGSFHFCVEIPAVYRDITNKSILERVEYWDERNRQRPSYAEFYMRRIADVRASVKAGLITDKWPVIFIGERMLEYAGLKKPRNIEEEMIQSPS